MSPSLYTEKAAAMNLTAKQSELQVGCRRCSVLTTAVQAKLLHSSGFFLLLSSYYTLEFSFMYIFQALQESWISVNRWK